VAFSPDGHYLVSGGEDNMLMVFDLNSMEPLYQYTNNYYPPRGIEVTQENTIFFGSGPDIKLIDMADKTLAVMKGNATHIWSVDMRRT
jgi:WD40 repeat protein